MYHLLAHEARVASTEIELGILFSIFMLLVYQETRIVGGTICLSPVSRSKFCDIAEIDCRARKVPERFSAGPKPLPLRNIGTLRGMMLNVNDVWRSHL